MLLLYCCCSGDPVITDRDFELVVLDEATQATEPAALVATAARVRYCHVLLLLLYVWLKQQYFLKAVIQ